MLTFVSTLYLLLSLAGIIFGTKQLVDQARQDGPSRFFRRGSFRTKGHSALEHQSISNSRIYGRRPYQNGLNNPPSPPIQTLLGRASTLLNPVSIGAAIGDLQSQNEAKPLHISVQSTTATTDISSNNHLAPQPVENHDSVSDPSLAHSDDSWLNKEHRLPRGSGRALKDIGTHPLLFLDPEILEHLEGFLLGYAGGLIDEVCHAREEQGIQRRPDRAIAALRPPLDELLVGSRRQETRTRNTAKPQETLIPPTGATIDDSSETHPALQPDKNNTIFDLNSAVDDPPQTPDQLQKDRYISLINHQRIRLLRESDNRERLERLQKKFDTLVDAYVKRAFGKEGVREIESLSNEALSALDFHLFELATRRFAHVEQERLEQVIFMAKMEMDYNRELRAIDDKLRELAPEAARGGTVHVFTEDEKRGLLLNHVDVQFTLRLIQLEVRALDLARVTSVDQLPPSKRAELKRMMDFAALQWTDFRRRFERPETLKDSERGGEEIPGKLAA